MKRSIALISFHYPPVQASSGLLRCLSFARSLREQGWDVTVLTASTNATSDSHGANELLNVEGIKVIRAFALDAARHFSAFGKYPDFLEVPDRYAPWILSGSLLGLINALRHRPSFILSSYPIASAHVIGLGLSRLCGIPWIADFRDPMILPGYPDSAHRIRAHRWVDAKAIKHCAAAIFTNERAKEDYRLKYPQAVDKQFLVIENGFDDHVMARAGGAGAPYEPITSAGDRTIQLVHNGALYRDHRDPSALFRAIAKLKAEGIWTSRIRLRFRASGADSDYRELCRTLGIEDCVSFEDSVDYVTSFREACAADGLLLVQGPSCNAQVPAKIYEYCAARKPILALTDKDGATAACLRRFGVDQIAAIDDVEAIKRLLRRICEPSSRAHLSELVPTIGTEEIMRSRRGAELVNLLESLLVS